MTKFNPKNKKLLTYGEALGPAMEITNAKDAKQYLDNYIKYLSKFQDNITEGNTPEKVAKINLGYYAGYYSEEVRKRVEQLFSCSHPVFGNSVPTSEEALECGRTGKTLAELRNKNNIIK